MAGATKRRQVCLDRLNLRTHNELAMAKNAGNRVIYSRTKSPALRSDVNEGYWTVVHSDLLIHQLACRFAQPANRRGPRFATGFSELCCRHSVAISSPATP